MIYVALFLAMILLRLVLTHQSRLRDQTYPIVLAILFLFVAFRLDVGCDWNGYHRHFLSQLDLGFADALAQREPLWWVLVQMVGALGLGYPWLNVVAALIFFAGVHALARKQPDRLGFLILLYPVLILNMPMSGIRQAASIGLMCMGFVAFSNGRAARFTIFTLLATGFHSSAGVFLLLAPLVGHGWIKARLLVAFALAGPGIYLLATGDSAQLALSRYVDTGVDAFGAFYRAALLALTSGLFFLILRPAWQARFPTDHRIVVLGALMMMATLPLIGLSSVIADRIGYFLVPLQATILARIPSLGLGTTGLFLSVAPYAVLLMMLVVWTVHSTHFHYCYLPYDSWLFSMPKIYQLPN
ncbi:EpsG family protein [Aliiroseovarius sp. Z3]|uniref:EpsG family protein n=1 Tax=Aliiroseovarius sp. Z3 TaxID=2811402 RepID=UPI0023B2536B|nr:EpsG family protein [Aliiroseovarius sp. Z3]MDE9450357.1 EpsG family protein [Aliiroseovarius sp. Z3]